MGFMKPKIPKPAPAPNPAVDPLDPAVLLDQPSAAVAAGSLINTTSRGLTRKANTKRVSLIGGSS